MKNLGLTIAVALSLSACVTINTPIGTGSTGNESIVTQYPVETALLNIYARERSDKLMAMVDNQNVSAEIKVTPKGAMLFNGKQVQGSEISTISKRYDQTTNQSVAINYFTLDPLVFHGFTDNTGRYSLSTQTTTIPKIATVGDSSKLLTETTYADSSMSRKLGTYNQDWSLTRNSNNTAWFCIETSENLLLNYDSDGTSTECYKINAQGDILASKVTIRQPTGIGSSTAVVFTSR